MHEDADKDNDKDKPKKAGDRRLRLVPTDEHEVVLHISLSDIEPSIWRRLAVSDAIDLFELHLALQGAFGWNNNHLHNFIVKQGESYSAKPTAFDFNADEEEGDSRQIHLRDLLLRQIKSFRYIYDMGDHWMHKIRIENVQPKSREPLSPKCIDGARQVPPEDCGGSLGYEELLEAWNDSKHPDHASVVQRLARDFDPELFDLQKANLRMKKMLNSKSP